EPDPQAIDERRVPVRLGEDLEVPLVGVSLRRWKKDDLVCLLVDLSAAEGGSDGGDVRNEIGGPQHHHEAALGLLARRQILQLLGDAGHLLLSIGAQRDRRVRRGSDDLESYGGAVRLLLTLAAVALAGDVDGLGHGNPLLEWPLVSEASWSTDHIFFSKLAPMRVLHNRDGHEARIPRTNAQKP